MKTLEFTDSELKELEGLLNSAISECLDDSFIYPFEEENKKQKNKQINIKNFTTKSQRISLRKIK